MDFDAFQVDFDRRQLFRGGEEVHLSPKALQLLQVLIAERPKALSRDEIHAHLWPDTFVAESNLASIVNELRRALDDNARTPKYIRTVHGFGYAFCAEPVNGRRQAVAAAKLVWQAGEAPLFKGRNIIGRDADSAVRVDDRTISRHHAVIVISDNRATLEDLDSKNGTFIDGNRVKAPADLHDGAVVEVGSVRLVYQEISTLSTATWYRK